MLEFEYYKSLREGCFCFGIEQNTLSLLADFDSNYRQAHLDEAGQDIERQRVDD